MTRDAAQDARPSFHFPGGPGNETSIATGGNSLGKRIQCMFEDDVYIQLLHRFFTSHSGYPLLYLRYVQVRFCCM